MTKVCPQVFSTALLQAQNLSKYYQLERHVVCALDNVSLDVQATEFVAITGASGSGKSTLMNILGCLDLPSSGTYSLAGEPVVGLGLDSLARVRNQMIGFVFQQFNLLPRMSALENVELPLIYTKALKGVRRQKALQALEKVGLLKQAHQRPSQLSGGQQQRVAIARALVNEPRIILADEPTGALDSTNAKGVMTLLGELNSQGITIVMVTHDAQVAAWAKRQLVFKDGRIIQDLLQNQIQA